jgi:DNA invertase Pin-like site-specific DNA recombinase
MDDLVAPGREELGDQTPVAAPPERLLYLSQYTPTPNQGGGGGVAAKRAVGVVRVSRVKNRKEDGKPGERFVSPGEQRERIAAACRAEGFRLVAEPFKELDTSGGAPLEKREGMRQAVEMVEAGKADLVLVAYFDRFVGHSRSSTRSSSASRRRVDRCGRSTWAR